MWVQMRHQLAALAAVVLFAQVGVFFLYATTSCQLPLHSDDPSISSSTSTSTTVASTSELRALVVSDIHLLGKRRRSWLERAWIDWQVHQPDLVLVLGDQFDEGGLPTPQSDWEEYVARFKHAFASFNPLKTLYLVGNHDTAFGRHMDMKEIRRYESAFGPSNYIEYIDSHAFVVINTMALDSDVMNEDVKAQATDFLNSVDTDELRARTANGSVVLLTHLPLFRADDMRCGDARARESGHVTYEHPSFPYAPHHHVLSQQLTNALLTKFDPQVVLSGHTHAWCASTQRHWNGAQEFTIPAFSWGQRPDPSYALLGLRRQERGPRRSDHQDHLVEVVSVVPCSVPSEHTIFALYIVTAAALALVNLRRRCIKWNARKIRLASNKDA